MLSDGKKIFPCLLKVRCIANSFLSGKDSNIVDKTIGYKNHFFPIGHHICSKHMTAFQSLLFILNARYSSFHMFFKPPSLLAAYNLKISDQAILGRTSTWTYTTIHTTTTYGSTDTRWCGFYFSLEMLQNSTKKTLFGLSIGAHHGVSNRTIFEPPSGTDDAGHWRSAGRIRMYVNVVFYYYQPLWHTHCTP